VLHEASADQVEVAVLHDVTALTRSAANTAHQNVAEINTVARVRTVVDKRTAIAPCNRTDAASLRALADTAERFARQQSENPELGSLPGPKPIAGADAFSESTVDCPPERRVAAVSEILQAARHECLEASGALSTESHELYSGTSLAVDAYHPYTVAHGTVPARFRNAQVGLMRQARVAVRLASNGSPCRV
jgi:predicted Zn-dependent protease